MSALKYVEDNWVSIWRRINAGGLVQHQIELAAVMDEYCAALQRSLDLAQAGMHAAQADAEREKGVADGLRQRVAELESQLKIARIPTRRHSDEAWGWKVAELESQLAEFDQGAGGVLATLASRDGRVAELEAENAGLRATLKRNRQGMQNILEFRKIAANDRYGALTREEVEGVIAEIDAALSAAPAEHRQGQDQVEIPLCPPHEGLLRANKLDPFGNCVVCIRNERDELRQEVARLKRRIAIMDASDFARRETSKLSPEYL